MSCITNSPAILFPRPSVKEDQIQTHSVFPSEMSVPLIQQKRELLHQFPFQCENVTKKQTGSQYLQRMLVNTGAQKWLRHDQQKKKAPNFLNTNNFPRLG